MARPARLAASAACAIMPGDAAADSAVGALCRLSGRFGPGNRADLVPAV